MPETVVHLVRHGQVENPRRVLYGRLPGYSLSTRGQAQAGLLARHFADVPLAAVLASPLERAQQTATPIAAAHGLEIRTDLRLIETSNVFEGVAGNVAWYILRHPKLWWQLRDAPDLPSAAAVDHAEAATGQPRVDTEHPHSPLPPRTVVRPGGYRRTGMSPAGARRTPRPTFAVIESRKRRVRRDQAS